MRQLADLATLVLRDAFDCAIMTEEDVQRRSANPRFDAVMQIARRILAGALVAVALMGAHGSLPAAHSVPEPSATAISEQRAVGEDWDCSGYRAAENPGARTLSQPEAKAAPGLPERVVSHVNGRMQGQDPEVCTRVAQTVLVESALAGVDPLLVLALIDVESTFNPNAKSNHGAVGLMQLKRRTMNDVLKRSAVSPCSASPACSSGRWWPPAPCGPSTPTPARNRPVHRDQHRRLLDQRRVDLESHPSALPLTRRAPAVGGFRQSVMMKIGSVRAALALRPTIGNKPPGSAGTMKGAR